MPLISVIIPVYNVAPFLNTCVDSVLQQSFRDIEVILVDDGSTDACPQICDEYALKDARVNVIHKVNGGLSDARNTGLKAATGDYVMFLDSDDYWRDGCLEQFVELEKKYHPEVVSFSRTRWYYKENRYVSKLRTYPAILNESPIEYVLEFLMRNDMYDGSACTKVLKREFLLHHDLFFVKGIKSEDIEWSFRMLSHVKNFKFINDDFYMYRKGREDSITNTINEKHLNDYVSFMREAIERVGQDVSEIWRKQMIFGYIAYHYCILLGLTNRIKISSALKKSIKQLKSILRHRMGKKSKLCYTIYRLMGYTGLRYVLGVYLKKRTD